MAHTHGTCSAYNLIRLCQDVGRFDVYYCVSL